MVIIKRPLPSLFSWKLTINQTIICMNATFQSEYVNEDLRVLGDRWLLGGNDIEAETCRVTK